MNLRDFFTPDAIAAQWTEVASNQIPYLGTGLFPARKKAGLDLRWIKGSKGLPISLMPSAFDAKATFRDRIGISISETEMPFFREGFHIKEKDRQELLRVQDSSDPYARAVIDRVFDDANNLIDGANVVPERMIMQLLFGGKIGIKANQVDYTYNYDQDGTWLSENKTELSEDSWEKASAADPFKTIKDVQDKAAEKTGTNITRAVMNTATFNLLAKIDAVKNRYLTSNGMSLGYLTANEVRNVILDTTGVQIAIYDKKYRDETGKTNSFIPDGWVSFLPDGALGSTWYGTTPEEADLMGGNEAEVSIVNTGVAITRILHSHPVNIETLASEIVLPSWERMDECYLVKVKSDP